MKSLVIYGSRYGNTEKIAYAIGAGLRGAGPVDILAIDQASALRLHEYDLVVIGGPTEGHTMTKRVSDYLLEVADSFIGRSVATFDTRMNWPKWLSGSAAGGMAGILQKSGATLVARPVSFTVAGKPPVLEPGELERAEGWGFALASDALAERPMAARS